MADYTPKPGSGSIFENDKGDNPKRPDWRGDLLTPDGKRWAVAAWNSETASGKKFVSLKLDEYKPPKPQPARQANPGPNRGSQAVEQADTMPDDDLDDLIPF